MKEHEKRLHIVSFNIPYPPDYGGVIDVFYRLKALHHAGIKIQLHCFEYGRNRAIELQKYCENIFYYKRRTGIAPFLTHQPYIVSSRKVAGLLKNLSSLHAPILFEGEHSTAYLQHPSLDMQPKWVRLHNIEHRYYNQLALQTNNIINQFYYRLEALKLSRYEKILQSATGLLSISQEETIHFEEINPNTHWLPAFHAEFDKRPQKPSQQKFLYHGDLTIPFNYKLARRLAGIFEYRPEELSIGGKMSTGQIKEMEQTYPSIQWHPNPDQAEMEQLLHSHSHHLIFAEHREGVKLKLVHSLLTGAKVIANKNAVYGSGLENDVELTTLNSLPGILNAMNISDKGGKVSRSSILKELYDNKQNAERLMNLIFNKQDDTL